MSIINPGIGCLTISSLASPAAAAVVWHPGFYIYPVYSGTTGLPLVMPTIETELADFDCFRGVQLKYSWNEIETGDGVYGGISGKIIPDLQAIGAIGSGVRRKRVFILLHLRTSATETSPPRVPPTTSSDASDVVPDWMIGDSAYNGGQWEYSNTTSTVPGLGGKMICLWNSNVQSRILQCIAAIGAALRTYTTADSLGIPFNPVEGIAISESSIGGVPMASQPSGATFPSLYQEKYWEGYYRICIKMKQEMPQVVVGAFPNQTKAIAKIMVTGGVFYSGGDAVAGFLTEGIGLGGPNVLPDDPGLISTSFDGGGNPGVYAYYASAAGVVPRIPSWQKPDYEWTRLDKSVSPPPLNGVVGHAPTVDEMYQFSKNSLFANYIFTTRHNVSPYWDDLKDYLISTGLKNVVSGGLDVSKPSCYTSINSG